MWRGACVGGLRANIVWALLGKEAREVWRDRRTLILTVLLPGIIYPVLLTGLGELTAVATLQLKARDIQVAVTAEVPEDVRAALSAEPKVRLHTVVDVSAPVKARDKDVGLELVAPPEGHTEPVLRLHLDVARDESRTAADRVEEVLTRVRDARLVGRLEKLGVHEDYIRPLPVERHNTSGKDRMGRYLASQMLPFLLIILSLAGATATAVDITAGERERGTLLTLLAAPVRAGEVAAAKLITVAAVAVFAGLANLVALSLSLGSMLARTGGGKAGGPEGMSIHVDASLVAGTLLALFPTALYGAALLLGLAALGKTTKEAQSSTAPAIFLALMLSAVTVVPGVRSNLMLNALPITGPALLMRDLVMETATWTQVITVLCSSAVTLWLMVTFAARVLTSEPMLSAHLSTTAVIREMTGERRPTPLTASLVAASLLAVIIYAAPPLQSRWGLGGLALTELLLAGVAVGVLALLRLDVRDLLGWRVPTLRAVVGSAMMGGTLWLPLTAALFALVELLGMRQALEEVAKSLQGMLMEDRPIWMTLLVAAGMAGVMEELAFRGVLFGVMLRVTTPRRALVLQAVVFALAHVSLVRFPPTLVLGLVLGLVRLRSGSVFPGMILHAFNNGAATLLTHALDLPPDASGSMDEMEVVSPALWAAFVATAATGAALVWRGALSAGGKK